MSVKFSPHLSPTNRCPVEPATRAAIRLRCLRCPASLFAPIFAWLALLASLASPVAAQAAGSVYVTNNGGSVSQYNIDPLSGALSPKTPATVATGSAPFGVAVTPDGKSAYVTNAPTNAVSQYDIDPLSGALSPKTPATVATGGLPDGVAVAPDGKSAYVTNRNDNTVSQYSIDPVSGALSPKTPATVATGDGPIGIAVQPLLIAPTKHATATTVRCSPGTVGVGQSATCTATVTDTASSGQTTPTGTVGFASNGPGAFSGSPCTLSGSGASASCSVSYTPSATGSGTHTITASYGGDTTHNTSNGTTDVRVAPTSKAQCFNGGWRNYPQFKNQGQCVKFVERGPS